MVTLCPTVNSDGEGSSSTVAFSTTRSGRAGAFTSIVRLLAPQPCWSSVSSLVGCLSQSLHPSLHSQALTWIWNLPDRFGVTHSPSVLSDDEFQEELWDSTSRCLAAIRRPREE